MIVLTTATDNQSFSFIPRSSTATVMILTDEQTNVSESVTIESYTIGDYVDTIQASFNLVEDRYYTVKLMTVGNEDYLQDNAFNFITTHANENICVSGYSGTNLITYYGKIFCTNQTDYTVNKDIYRQKQSENNFIFV